jgi:thermitase
MRRVKTFLLLAVLLLPALFGRAANSIVWDAKNNTVSADVRGEALWPLLEDIAHQTGWHIFVEPGLNQKADAKFSQLNSGEALKKLLGDLNFAYVPKTNEANQLYVFATTLRAATMRVSAVATNQPAVAKHVANELIVKVKPGTDIDALAKSLGAKVTGRNDKLGIYRLQFADAAATDAALASLQNNPAVTAVDYNYIYDAPPTPQALANATGAAPKLTLDATTPGDPCNPVIGLIDTAVQPSGGALDQFMLPPVSVVSDGSPTTSGISHGTAMYQTILNAVSQSSGGHTGVKILPVQVFGSSESATTWNVALGVQAAVDGGATVLNMSLGGAGDSAVLTDVIQQALAKGIVVFAAAGNMPVSTPTYPAAIPGVNSVTALSSPGQLASYANYGSFSSLALPGTSIVYQGGQAWVVQGTSPATAYATGVAVGTKSVNCAGWSQIESAMQQKFPVPAK